MKKINGQHNITVNIISLCCIFLFMAAAAIIHGGMLFGHQLKNSGIPGIEQRGDTTIINTTDICPEITGYSGPVPVSIAIVDNRIVSVTTLPNAETASFFKRVTDSGLLDRWTGMTPHEALTAEVDGVTGATYSSTAVIANVRSGLAALTGQRLEPIVSKPIDKTGHDDGSSSVDTATKVIQPPTVAKPAMPARKTTKATVAAHDTAVINTIESGAEISGFNGPVPVEITVIDGRVAQVRPLDNEETPKFFKRVTDSGILDSWTGLTVAEAEEKEIDGVTGATFSSKALIENVRAGLADYKPARKESAEEAVTAPVEPAYEPPSETADEPGKKQMKPETIAAAKADTAAAAPTDNNLGDAVSLSGGKEKTDPGLYAALAVLIAAMSLPLFWKNPKYRLAQQLLNVGVLGFWTGTFVDYIMMLRILGSGVTLTGIAAVVPLLMLVAAFIYPLFGKNGYYCAWVCPLGSIQELASRCNKNHRLHLSPRTVKILTNIRMLLWGGLMLCLWTGLWMSWVDYELFSAFLIEQASVGVIVAGSAFVVLSIWIPRPYCRFVCPTGTILRMSQNLNTH